MSNKDIFIFKASKADQSKSNASIERWEREIRKFAKNVRINFWDPPSIIGKATLMWRALARSI